MRLPETEITAFCQRHCIIKLSLFGSALQDQRTLASDLDVLVIFNPDHIPGLIQLAGMEIELSKILGTNVDLRTPEDLSPYFREEVLETAEVQYAQEG